MTSLMLYIRDTTLDKHGGGVWIQKSLHVGTLGVTLLIERQKCH